MKRQLTRKAFLKLSATAAVALPTLGLSAHAFKNKMTMNDTSMATRYSSHPGLQLYTLRENFAKDPKGTLKRIAAIGFKELEFYDASLLTYSGEVKDLGMSIVGTHMLSGYITGIWDTKFIKTPPTNKLENIIETCVKYGVKNLGIGILFPDEHKTFEDFKRFAEKANLAGEKTKAAGIQLYYHNHSFEFKPTQNTTPFESILAILDKNLVTLELDVFWTTIAGNNAADWIKKLDGRIKFLHLKDLKKNTPIDHTTFGVPPAAFTALGDGSIDFKTLLIAAHAANIPYTFVEQDHSAIDPFESITRSFNFLKKLGE